MTAAAPLSAPAPVPVFSVVVPARNAARFLGATLASLARQDLAGFEAIVVDDGSTDGTAAIAAEAAAGDGRFRLLPGPARGVSAARNAGFAASRGAFVLFLDADDLLAADALSRFAEALGRPGPVAALGGIRRIDEGGGALPGRDNRPLAEAEDQVARLLTKNFVVNGGALAIRRAAVEAAGGYDPALAYGEDWEFWVRIAEQGPIAILPGAPVLAYRQVGSGANYRARGSALAMRVPCLDVLAARPALRARYGARLGRLLRARRIDIFWSGVRSEYQFGSRVRALGLGLAGMALYPDSLARPGLALRFFASLGRSPACA